MLEQLSHNAKRQNQTQSHIRGQYTKTERHTKYSVMSSSQFPDAIQLSNYKLTTDTTLHTPVSETRFRKILLFRT